MKLVEIVFLAILFVGAVAWVMSASGCASYRPLPKLDTSIVAPADIAIEKAKDSAKSVTFLCLLGTIISVFAFANGSKSASAMLIASLVGLGLSLTIVAYAKLIAFLTLAGSVIWFVGSVFLKGGFWTLPTPKKT